ncbi:MAG TPA: hypothetical protein DD990_13770 [Cyanobacteria bacterium UBA11368]|nr:hypothetical protein [Cyanobacteria bacterium UBA11368]
MVNQITASSSAKAKSGATYASTPVGRSGSPIEVQRGTNFPTTIFDRQYSGHALDRMQGRGILPSVVENAILTGQDSPGSRSGTTSYYDQVNALTVVINTATGRIITVRQGSP